MGKKSGQPSSYSGLFENISLPLALCVELQGLTMIAIMSSVLIVLFILVLLERPEDDGRSLFEKLQDQKDKKQQDYEDQFKFSKSFYHLQQYFSHII